MRWTPTRKAETVIAIEKGSITTGAAKKNYRLSDEELAAWMCNYSVRGLAGLRATKPRHDRSRLPQEAEGVIWRTASIKSRASAATGHQSLVGRTTRHDFSERSTRPPSHSLRACVQPRSSATRTAADNLPRGLHQFRWTPKDICLHCGDRGDEKMDVLRRRGAAGRRRGVHLPRRGAE